MEIKLPKPEIDSRFSVEKALAQRRSIRQYSTEQLSLSHISQLLWAAQGITRSGRFRTAPSAGALYPLEVYLVVGMVKDLYPGVYHYHPAQHILTQIKDSDEREQLSKDALGQKAVATAPLNIVITAIYERTMGKYGKRGIQYVHIDAGHAGQNICLQATALGLGTVPVGAFHDDLVAQTLQISKDEIPLCIYPVGIPRN